jgi:hypothetical protein
LINQSNTTLLFIFIAYIILSNPYIINNEQSRRLVRNHWQSLLTHRHLLNTQSTIIKTNTYLSRLHQTNQTRSRSQHHGEPVLPIRSQKKRNPLLHTLTKILWLLTNLWGSSLSIKILWRKEGGYIFPAFPENGIFAFMKSKVVISKDE